MMTDKEMTPAESIGFMLTLPWIKGDVTDEGATFSEGEIKTILNYVRQIKERAEAVEAEAAELRAEVERLREAAAQAKADGASEERSLHWMQASRTERELRAEVERLRARYDELVRPCQELVRAYWEGREANEALAFDAIGEIVGFKQDTP